jgi:hypothetical protein
VADTAGCESRELANGRRGAGTDYTEWH